MFQVIVLLLTGLIVTADQVSKWWARTALQNGALTVWDGVFEFRLNGEGNTGGAWGILSGHQWILIAVTTIVMALILILLMSGKLRKKPLAVAALVMILGGGTGNLIDRVIAGSVTDFLNTVFIRFPTFNVADCFIVIGTVLLVVYLVFFYDDTPRSKRARRVREETAPVRPATVKDWAAAMGADADADEESVPTAPQDDDDGVAVPLWTLAGEESGQPTADEPPIPTDEPAIPVVPEQPPKTKEEQDNELQDILDSILGTDGRTP